MKNNIKISENEINNQLQVVKSLNKLLLKAYPVDMPLAYVHSFGCQQNVNDGEKIKGFLAQMGYGFTDTIENAKIIVYNTCAIRENAEDKVFGNIGELKHYKKNNPDGVVVLCGCMTQEEHVVNRILRSYPQIDIIFGTHVLHTFPSILMDFFTSHKRVINTTDSDGIIAENLPIKRDSSFKANVPIMFGCNNFCSYCIVPFVRGRERSRTSQDILNEVENLIAQGCKEITLLGQNVNSYGVGLDEEINFSTLLRKINALSGDFIIRFMTSHPKDATFELIDTIKECDKVCNHIHLPIQSGSDNVLKLMNRNYTVSDYLKLVEYAKQQIDGISFTSDIIVGFPGETNEDFLQTLELLKKVQFDSLFTFIFSKREGTAAAKMIDETPQKEKSERFSKLIALQKQIGENRYTSYIGKVVRVLVDGKGKVYDNCLTGRMDNFAIVDFNGDANLIGSFVNVKITKVLNWALFGEII